MAFWAPKASGTPLLQEPLLRTPSQNPPLLQDALGKPPSKFFFRFSSLPFSPPHRTFSEPILKSVCCSGWLRNRTGNLLGNRNRRNCSLPKPKAEPEPVRNFPFSRGTETGTVLRRAPDYRIWICAIVTNRNRTEPNLGPPWLLYNPLLGREKGT